MARCLDDQPPCHALVEIARDFHARGWVAGTAGNLSARADADSFWITASGHPKGRLEIDDFLRVRVSDAAVMESPNPRSKPSAETSIHQVIYRLFPQAGACLHVHSVDACLATDRVPAQSLSMPLPSLEMIKGLGIWEQDPKVELPLFPNWLDVTAIAEDIEERFGLTSPAVPALMIRGHGMTVWGGTLQQAYNRVEIVEFLMSYLARRP